MSVLCLWMCEGVLLLHKHFWHDESAFKLKFRSAWWEECLLCRTNIEIARVLLKQLTLHFVRYLAVQLTRPLETHEQEPAPKKVNFWICWIFLFPPHRKYHQRLLDTSFITNPRLKFSKAKEVYWNQNGRSLWLHSSFIPSSIPKSH